MSEQSFRFEGLSVTLLTPVPIDVTAGIVLNETSFLGVAKEDPKLLRYKVGIGGEVWVDDSVNDVRVLELKYLPNASAISTLEILKNAKTRFGILIQNTSSPRYKGISSNCRILEKPNLGVGNQGFANLPWRILLLGYSEVYLNSVL
ncbi:MULTISPECIES: hypothetical protein [Leptospira]|uniref:hypothetical protein n=1 Tax=Leptospira TaxID=171 RepID=UPI0003466D51|nr:MULTISPECIES: hypothetical protein [Leptospira]UML79158.1 hypothetical protein FH602_12485 [Leptospira kirschneri]UML80350.1 hypothetical protein FH602_19230 [Leptospira kirschneri]UMQ54045.1 hypothetical protein FH582_19380 [Leptospira interrogans]